MALFLDVLYLLMLIFVFVLLPAVLLVSLYLLSRRYRGMFDRIGFTRKEIGLLIFGSLSATLFSIDIPIIVFGPYLLAFNVAGALIPTVLSIHLIRAKRIHPVSWSLGVAAVSAIAYFVTRVQPRAGIVAEFPWLFVPSLTAAGLALVLYSRKSPKAPAYAYATATLGSLIGADFLHLPELFSTPGFIGSFGGAGIRDLVYLAGVISLAIVLIFATANLRKLRASPPRFVVRKERVDEELAAATRAFMQGHWQASVQRMLVAVQTRMRQLSRDQWTPLDRLAVHFFGHPRPWAAYGLLQQYDGRGDANETVARWAMVQGEYLLDELEGVQRSRYASIGRRIGAFAIDAVAMSAIVVLIGYAVFAAGDALAEPLVLLITVLFWAWSIQLLYFTAFEWLWKGYTPGKRLLRIRVMDLDGRPPDFITAFTRNVVRILDFALFAYAVALLVIVGSRRMQRIGDQVAQTVVVAPDWASTPEPVHPRLAGTPVQPTPPPANPSFK